MTADAALGTDLSELRLRWQDLLTGRPLDLTRADVRSAVDRQADAARRDLEELRPFGSDCLPWHDLNDHHYIIGVHTSFTRLADLALAYRTEGGDLAGDVGLRDRMLQVLEGLLRFHYHPDQLDRLDLWWHREYGIPLALIDLLTLLGETVTEDLRNSISQTIVRFLPTPTHMMDSDERPRRPSTGANRMWQATIHAVLGALLDQPAMVTAAAEARSDVFVFTESGDGFHTDGSFLQHDRHPYNGGYGRSLLTSVARQASWLRGTAWALSSSEWQIVGQWVDESFVPFVFRGGIVDMVRGREIARSRNDPHVGGHEIASAMLELAEGAGEAAARRWRAIVAGWIASDTYRDFWSTAGPRALMLASTLERHREPAEPEVCRVYPAMDRALLKGKNFSFTVSMHSSRIAAYECISHVNPRGWYTAAGMTQLHNGDVRQYGDGYWATVDHHRLSGVTHVVRGLPDEFGAGRCGARHWAGGASVDGFAAVGMDLEFPPAPAASEVPTITGKKSWFLLGGLIACLGSEIGTSDGASAETVIDSRRISGEELQTIEINGHQVAPATCVIKGHHIRTVHLAHPADGASIGYLLPAGGAVRLEVATRHGRWSQVNPRELDTDRPDLTSTYFTLSVVHGQSASDGAYCYIVAPGTSAAVLEAMSGEPPVTVLEQSDAAHAVRYGPATAINFWQGGATNVAGIRVNTAASVLLIEHEDRVTLGIADPTQLQSSIELTLDAPWLTPTKPADPRVRVAATGQSHVLIFDVAHSEGRTLRATLARRGSWMTNDEVESHG